MEPKKPYLADYAKSSRASCRACHMSIQQGTLRIAHLVQARNFDGFQTNWHHWSCFFGRFRPDSVSDIDKFRSLRVEDQDRIQMQMKGPSKKGKGRGGNKSVAGSLKDFVVQYALSGKSSCRKCFTKIEKEEIRISKKGLDEDKPYLGQIDRWYHVGCFLKKRRELEWKDSDYTVDMITGFDAMDSKDQETLKSIFNKKAKGKKNKNIKDESLGEIQLKRELPGETEEEREREKKLRAQNQKLWKIIDALTKAALAKAKLVMLLEDNEQALPPGNDRLRERVADGLMFGRLAPCDECGGQLVAKEDGYQCYGDLSEWTSCTNRPLTAKRLPWTIPEKLRAEYAFLNKHKYKKVERLFAPRPPVKPLKNKKILTFGKFDICVKEVKEMIANLGGGSTNSMHKAYCAISTKEGMEANQKKVNSAELADTFIVDIAFLDACAAIDDEATSLVPLLRKHSIAPFGSEKKETSKQLKRLLAEEENKESKKQRLMVKNGVAVDPETELEEETEVVSIGGTKYTATLSLVNVSKGFNSYYKLQLLKANHSNRWFIFRAWGRVGTSIGGKKTEDFRSLEAAKNAFDFQYEDKTGNEFGCTNFVKLPNKFFPLDIEYGENDDSKKIAEMSKAGADSKLHVSVQTLIKQIFDIESMKKTMLEFELDLNKMPLGKLSRQQMQNAYKILSDAIKLVDAGTLSGPRMLDVSNKFYTLIPHNFGFSQPTPLSDMQIINSKIRMLESLMEIEYAYNILDIKQEDSGEKEDILDTHYKKLHCDIKPLDDDTEEYKIVEKYASLTHATTHTGYKLKIENVFKINREGEEETFKPFQMLKNHKLLWHGSRTTNYAGILSQGLRIAPPEAPVTGYMFGKGVYFADMVSKSANYCAANSANPYGYALLADVALGNMMELTKSKYVRKLPRGKHSVKGLGSNIPNPKDHVEFAGMEVPMGTQIGADLSKMKHGQTELLYNEYIVYDVSQINMKYLVKFKFDYQSSLW